MPDRGSPTGSGGRLFRVRSTEVRPEVCVQVANHRCVGLERSDQLCRNDVHLSTTYRPDMAAAVGQTQIEYVAERASGDTARHCHLRADETEQVEVQRTGQIDAQTDSPRRYRCLSDGHVGSDDE